MVEANLGIYNLLRPQRTAFDYFLKGQEARQQHDMNTQMMQARQQQMQQAALMNPLLLERAQSGIDLENVQRERIQALQPGELLGQAASLRASEAATARDVQATEHELALQPGEIAQQQAQLSATKQSAATSRAQEKRNQYAQTRAEKIDLTEDAQKMSLTIGNLAEQALEIKDPVQQWQFVRQKAQELFPGEEVDLRNINLEELVKTKDALVAHSTKGANFQKGATIITTDKDGNKFFETNMVDPKSGNSITSKTPVSGDIVDKQFGETAEEKTERKGKEAKAVQLNKMSTTQKLDYANNGLDAADSLSTLHRSMQLLNESVDTGFTQGLAVKAKNYLGISSANEGELSYNLAKNVLQQLKPVFGSQFTAKEGEWLERIEAGILHSPPANRRIIDTAIKKAERIARRGIKAAEEAGDTFLASEIQDSLDQINQMKAESASPPASATGMSDEEIMSKIQVVPQ